MIEKKKKKGNGSYTALFLPDTSVYWGPGGGGGGAIPGERSLNFTNT